MQRRVIEFDQGWDYIMEKGFNKLRRILEGLPEPPFDADQYMMLYTTTYNMCIQKAPHNYAQQLYDNYGETFEEYITSTVLPSLRDKHDEFLLQELAKRWGCHKVMVRWMSRFFHYLDFYFIPQRSLPSLKEVGHGCFCNLVYQEVNANARVAVLGQIRNEREGEQIDRALLKTVIHMFVEIGIGEMNAYQVDFEKHMLKDTIEYYSRKASRWTLEDSCADYMLKAEGCLRSERERVSHYLHSSSEEKLLEKVQHELLEVYANQFFEKEDFLSFLRDGKAEDLARMYTLYHKIPRGFESVAKAFQQHITAKGTALVQQAEDAASNHSSNGAEQVLVRKIIELHDKYMARVNDCFMNHSLFHKAIEDVLEVVCNKAIARTSSAELFAAFCDNILKKGGSEKLSDEAIEEALDKVVKLLPYIHEKKLFADFYWKKLARRLLFYRSVNKDHEKCILAKLKQQCGGKFTSKMEAMLTDLALARENQACFEEYLCNNPNVNPGMDLSVTVLTTGFWPSYKSFDLNLPAEMMKCVQVFQEFYETERNNRKLTWVYSMGTCNIIGKCEPKEIELVVSTYQAAVLLLFNTADRLSYPEISAQLNLTGDDLVRILHSLSCSKYKILIKVPNTKTISPNDNFEFNSKFADRMKRIKIPLPTVDERKEVIQDVDKDRRYATDAAIVRIMKSRKVLAHRQLVVECVDQLRHTFKPDIKAIKKRIEDLITRDYLEMDKGNLNMVRYLP